MKTVTYPPVKSLVVPLELGNLIIPRNLMVEMIHIEKQDESKPINWLDWQGKRLPLISLEALCLVDPKRETNKHCIILNTLLDNEELAFVAIQSKGSPHSVEVTEATLRDDHKKNEKRCPYIASHVRVGNIPCMIPDLPAIELAILEMIQIKKKTNVNLDNP